jgi:hypothetical protein
MALGLVTSFAAPAAGDTMIGPHHVAQSSGEVELLVWVSQEALAATAPPAGLPDIWWASVEQGGAGFRRYVSSLSPELGPGPCLPLPGPEPMVLPPETARAPRGPVDFASSSATSALVVLGEVRSIEPGLGMVGSAGITTRIRVTVSEILRDDRDSVAPGDQLVYLSPGGSLLLGGASLCGVEQPAQRVPEPGATLLVAMAMAPDPSGYFTPFAVFAVDEGTVEVPFGTAFRPGGIPLDELRAAVDRPADEGPP